MRQFFKTEIKVLLEIKNNLQYFMRILRFRKIRQKTFFFIGKRKLFTINLEVVIKFHYEKFFVFIFAFKNKQS